MRMLTGIRGELDARTKASESRRSQLARELAAGSAAALKSAESLLREEAAVAAERQLAEAAVRLVEADARRSEQELGRRERLRALQNFEALKLKRGGAARKVEGHLRALAADLAGMEEFTVQIEAQYRALGGGRLILPPLARSAVGSRMSEFCTGLGLGGWLPVMCAETKPPPGSFEEIERQAQAQYRISAEL